MNKSKKLLSLMVTFMKISLFTFGGGYAMISLIDHECVEKRGWLTPDEFADLTVIAESTPGPISVNCATYVGYRQAGFAGTVLATVGMIIPSFAIIYILSLFFSNILEITVIANAFKGIKVAVGILILSVGTKMLRVMKKQNQQMIIMACALAF